MADPVITTLRILGTRAYINGARASATAIRGVGKAGEETGAGMQILKGTFGSVTGALGILSSVAKSTGLILGALAGYGAKIGLEFDASIERSTVGMTTLLGSSKDAKRVVQQVQAFALKAPMLSVADAIQSSQMLIGAGLNAKKAVPTMTAFSDTLSAMGRKPEDLQRMTYAFQQMMSKGQISAEELRGQLGEIFPASKLLAKGMGISMKELADRMKTGSLKGQKYIDILLTQMEKEFHGATGRSAQTFSGMLNNIKENARYTMGLVWMPLFKVLKNNIFPWVQKIQTKIQNWAKGGGVNRLIKFAKQGFNPARPGPKTTALGQAGDRLQPRKAPKGVLEKGAQLMGKLASKIIPELKKQGVALWDAFKPAEPFLKNVLLPFAVGFAVGLYKGLTSLIPVIKIVAQVLGWIGTKAAPLKPVFFAIGAAIGFVFGPGKLGIFRLFGKVFEALIWPIKGVFNWLIRISPLANRVAVAMMEFPGKVLGAMGSFVGKVASLMQRVGSAMLKPFKSLGKSIGGFISSSIGAVISAIVNFGTQIAQALWDALPPWMQKLLRVGVKGFVSALKSLGGKAPRKNGVVGGLGNPGKGPRKPSILAPKRRAGGGLTSGLTLVGEQGPELAQFPSNTYIHPSPQLPTLDAMNISLYAPIYWKGREVAAAVAEDTSDKKARR